MSAGAGAAVGAPGRSTTRSLRHAPSLPWVVLLAYVLVIVACSWQRWGAPVNDVGLDLGVAQRWLDGALPYRDVRYWYGPLGISVLSAAFAVYGASLWVAIGVGFAQTLLIADLTRRIARRWLPNAATAATVGVVLSIGFSGSLCNFILPHTFAATLGAATLLGVILALVDGRPFVAGLCVGLTALTRPEFLAFAVAAVAGGALGAVRAQGWGPAIRGAAVSVVGTVLVAVPVLGFFVAKAGLHRVLLENIFPVEFLRVSGAAFEHDLHPLDLPSFAILVLRGTAVAAGVLAFLALWALVARRRGGAPAAGRLPVSPRTAVLGLAGGVVLSAVLGAADGGVRAPFDVTKSDLTRFLLPMTALPAVAVGTALVAAVAWLRGRPSPLDEGTADGAARRVLEPGAATEVPTDASSTAVGSDAGRVPGAPGWIAAGALLAAAFVCTVRMYAGFSTDFYATYYAPPAVILGAVVVWRATRRFGAARVAVTTTVLSAAALMLSAHAVLGLYRDYTYRVTAPAGSFGAKVPGGPNAQGVIDYLRPRMQPGDRLLALPQEPGWLFLLNARPALYDTTFLPGVLGTAASDRRAAQALLHGGPGSANAPSPYRPPRFVIEATWNLAPWGFKAEGVDVNVALERAIHSRYRVVARFGDTGTLPPASTTASAYTVLELR